jgi:hypothetical protein
MPRFEAYPRYRVPELQSRRLSREKRYVRKYDRRLARHELRCSNACPGRAVMTTTIAARRADSIRLGPWHQGAVYGATAALAVSGIIWLVLHYFLAVPGEYGPQIHPLEPWMLRLHGAAAMAGLIIYGSLLPVHVRRAWSIRRNIVLGIGLVAVMLLLTVTGYLLYYSGDENTRPLISAVHWILGLVVPALLVWHIVSGRMQTRVSETPSEPMDNRV